MGRRLGAWTAVEQYRTILLRDTMCRALPPSAWCVTMCSYVAA